MKIKTLTWNIGGGKLIKEGADPGLLASYTRDGIYEIIELLRVESPDIITLQETHKNDRYDQIKIIADSLGYSYVHDSISDSHIDTDYRLGHALLTRYHIKDHDTGFFYNPELQITLEDGSTDTGHDKGYTTCKLQIGGQLLMVTTVHIIPFRRFGIDLQSGQAKIILNNIEDTLANNYSPWLIQGDFNIDNQSIRQYFPKLFDKNTSEIQLVTPTTPKGRKYDHIIIRGGKLLNHRAVSDALTDHYPVIAEIEI